MNSISDLQVLVISMRNAVLRQRLMHAQLDLPGMPPYQILEGINVKELSVEQIKASYDPDRTQRRLGRQMTGSEIGCALSHLRAFQYVQDQNIKIALILEDDALIGYQFLKIMDRLIPKIDSSRPEIILLSHVGRFSAWAPTKVDKLHSLFAPHSAFGAHGYLVTRAAASVLARQLLPIHTVADDWRNMQKRNIVGVKALVPYCIGTSILANDSQIGTERFLLDSRSKFQRFYRKYLYKKFFFQFVEKPMRRLRKIESTW